MIVQYKLVCGFEVGIAQSNLCVQKLASGINKVTRESKRDELLFLLDFYL